jgi:hypothetical protein
VSTPSTCLNLLAPNGIIHVTFDRVLTGDQYVELTRVVDAAKTVQQLENDLLAMGLKWGIIASTQLVSPKRSSVEAAR